MAWSLSIPWGNDSFLVLKVCYCLTSKAASLQVSSFINNELFLLLLARYEEDNSNMLERSLCHEPGSSGTGGC